MHDCARLMGSGKTSWFCWSRTPSLKITSCRINPVFIHAVFISTCDGFRWLRQRLSNNAVPCTSNASPDESWESTGRLGSNRVFIERWVSHNIKLTHSSNLGKFVPGILSMEITTLRFEIRGCKVWVIFDGATGAFHEHKSD